MANVNTRVPGVGSPLQDLSKAPCGHPPNQIFSCPVRLGPLLPDSLPSGSPALEPQPRPVYPPRKPVLPAQPRAGADNWSPSPMSPRPSSL